ncbi:MAG: alpha/beta fold hydrolase [Nitrospira sp.]|nr:alpha/beta fold hydrolase [Nitrospira sp.]
MSYLILLVAAVLATPAFANDLGRGTSVDDWKGFGVLKGGKGYAQTPMGQVHYRDLGPRDDEYPLILLHQSPMSMIQWAAVQNILVDRGYRVITVDTPGYGLSDPPLTQPSIRDFANNMVYLLDHLKLNQVVLGGHHTGSHIAVSFTANHPERVVSLVLHGAALMTAEEASGYIARARLQTPRTPVANGAHLTRYFNLKKRTPEAELTAATTEAMLTAGTWAAITEFMQGPDIGHWAAYRYDDMLSDMRKIKQPTMLLSDTGDPVNAMDRRLAGLRPDFKYVEFSRGSSLTFMLPELAAHWADIYGEWRKSNIESRSKK